MTATTIVNQTTHKILFIAGQFRIYQVDAGKSFAGSAREIFANESYDACQEYLRSIR